MRHGNPGAVRILFAIGKIITHDLRQRLLAAVCKVDVAVIAIGGQPLGRLVGRKGNRCLSLPIMTLAAYPGKFDMANLLGNRPEGCTGPDCLQLLMVADKNDLCAALFRFSDEPGKLTAPDHAGLVNDKHVTATDQIPAKVPTAGPRCKRAALHAGTFLKTLGCLSGQRRSMDLIALRLPRLASGCKHGGLSSTGKPDHSGDAFSPCNMRNRVTLFVRQSR